MKKQLLLFNFLVLSFFLFGQESKSDFLQEAKQQTKHVAKLIGDMPVESKERATIKSLRTVTTEQSAQLLQLHEDVYTYVDQIRTKYGNQSPEVKEEIDYQKRYYFKQLRKILNTHQYFYLKSIHEAKGKTLEDVVDVNSASGEEIVSVKERLKALQALTLFDFSQL